MSSSFDDDQSYGDMSYGDMSEGEEAEEETPSAPTTTRVARKTQKSRGGGVRFHESITVRHYKRILGDNPSVIKGPPLTIDWTHFSQETTPLDDFETARAPHRRTEARLRLHSNRKRDILLRSGVTQSEIDSAMKSVQKAQKQRQQSQREGHFLARTTNEPPAAVTESEIRDSITSASKAQKQQQRRKGKKMPTLSSAVQRMRNIVVVG